MLRKLNPSQCQFFSTVGGNVNVAVMGGSMLNPNGSLDRNGGIILIIRVVS